MTSSWPKPSVVLKWEQSQQGGTTPASSAPGGGFALKYNSNPFAKYTQETMDHPQFLRSAKMHDFSRDGCGYEYRQFPGLARRNGEGSTSEEEDKEDEETTSFYGDCDEAEGSTETGGVVVSDDDSPALPTNGDDYIDSTAERGQDLFSEYGASPILPSRYFPSVLPDLDFRSAIQVRTALELVKNARQALDLQFDQVHNLSEETALDLVNKAKQVMDNTLDKIHNCLEDVLHP